MKLIHYGADKLDLNKIKPIKNWWKKPKGGLWTSPINSKYGWKQWCDEEDFSNGDNSKYFVIELKTNARICKIDSPNDFIKLPFIKEGNYKFLDFEEISKTFDAIHLTIEGLNTVSRARFSIFQDLYGWDVETVLILNKDCIKI